MLSPTGRFRVQDLFPDGREILSATGGSEPGDGRAEAHDFQAGRCDLVFEVKILTPSPPLAEVDNSDGGLDQEVIHGKQFQNVGRIVFRIDVAQIGTIYE